MLKYNFYLSIFFFISLHCLSCPEVDCSQLSNDQGNFVADENGSNEPLRKYSQKTLVIVLPGDLTVFDIGETITSNAADENDLQ